MAERMRTPPETAKVTSTERIYRAVKALELAVLDPPVEADRIFMGFGNDLALPADSNEYIVNTILQHVPHGTPAVHYALNEAGEYEAHIIRLDDVFVQVDCYSDDPETARQRAQCLASILRTTPGADFFETFGLSGFYADPPQNTTVVLDADKYVQRYTVVLHIGFCHRMVLNSRAFEAVGVRVRPVL